MFFFFIIPAGSGEHLHPSLTSFVACVTNVFVSAQRIDYVAVNQLESIEQNSMQISFERKENYLYSINSRSCREYLPTVYITF